MKKLISILMVICLLLSAGVLSASAAEETVVNYWIAETPDIDHSLIPGTVIGNLGDVDQSQAVNVRDATAIQKHVASIAEFADDILILADADLSGDITVKDATAIQKWVAGMDVDFLINHAVYLPFAYDENIFGTWETTREGAGIINEMIPLYSDDPLLVEHVNIETFIIKEVYTFKEDGSYILTIDEEVLATSVAKVKLELQGDMENYLEAVSEEYGLNMSVQKLLAVMGYSSMENLVDDMFPTEMLEAAAVPTEGYYRTAEGKLYMDEFSDTYYEYYSIEGDVMTITGNSENLFPEEYPIVLNRVG